MVEFVVVFAVMLLAFMASDKLVTRIRGYVGAPLPLWWLTIGWVIATCLAIAAHALGWVSLPYVFAISLAWALSKIIDWRRRKLHHRGQSQA